MKKLVLVSLKTFAFFVGWAICVSILPIPDTKSAAVWRFWAELIPLLSVIGFTIIFWLIDKRNIRLYLTGKPVYNIVLGCITGAIWLGVSVVILSLTGVIHIDGRNQISMLWLWLFSAFINSVMQEVLVRGYLYQMIKNNYNIVVAVLISTGCVNDTWLITWNKIPPKTPTKLSAFLGKITRNLALDNFRKKNASKRADTHMMDICGEVEKLENTIKDYVEEDIKKKEILNILEKFLSDLKAGDRDIFVRRYWYMDNIKDIAKRHGCSETKIKSSLFRSRNRLWEEVKEII